MSDNDVMIPDYGDGEEEAMSSDDEPCSDADYEKLNEVLRSRLILYD